MGRLPEAQWLHPDSDPVQTPDTDGAQLVMARMKELGVLVSTDGPHRNVLKMKPPICFNASDAEDLANVMDQALSELPPLAATPTFAAAAPASAAAGLVPDVVAAMLARHGATAAPAAKPNLSAETSSSAKATSAVRNMLVRHR